MNKLSIRLSSSKYKFYNNVNMLVFDMAGTTVNEKGIVYDKLYDTIKNFGLNISREEINKWHGSNKYEVMDHYLNKDNIKVKESIKQQLHNNLKERYFYSSSIDLIDPNIPILFNRYSRIYYKEIKDGRIY
jgi:beta-phosphoglucomutase-like phosphatase (HAD superfamily)